MKKLLILCFVLAVSFAAVTGSIAFFTDSVASDDNVITAGSIDVEQYEQERTGEGTVNADQSVSYTLAAFSPNQPMYPCVMSATSPTEVVRISDSCTVTMYTKAVQNFRDKIVTAQNVGKSPCYVRTFVAVPAAVEGNEWIHVLCNEAASEPDWVWQYRALTDVTIDNVVYDIHVGTYTKLLPAGETASPSLLGVYMDGRVSNNGNQLVFIDEQNKAVPIGEQPSLSILVATEAAQTLTFTDAYDALNTTFGYVTVPDGTTGITAGHHPWSK